MIILTLTLALCSILGLTACGGNNENGNDDNPPHIHEFTTLKYDTTSHWFECECGDKKILKPIKVERQLKRVKPFVRSATKVTVLL